MIKWNHSIWCVLWCGPMVYNTAESVFPLWFPSRANMWCVAWLRVLLAVKQPWPAVGAATVQRSVWCNENVAGIKRWIRGENSPHGYTNTAITPRLMTQHSLRHAHAHMLMACTCLLLNIMYYNAYQTERHKVVQMDLFLGILLETSFKNKYA